MRFLAALLILANLILYLLVNRLPEVESVAPPDINLPRVTRIELLDPERPASQDGKEQSRCFLIGGFLTPTGARNWLLLRGLPLTEHRIIRNGLVVRPVLSLYESGVDHSPFIPSRQPTTLQPFSSVIRADGQLRREFLFADSETLAASSVYRTENKRSLSLESDRVNFYSYAIVGGEGLHQAWSQRFAAGYSGNLTPESCQSVAKQGQNP